MITHSEKGNHFINEMQLFLEHLYTSMEDVIKDKSDRFHCYMYKDDYYEICFAVNTQVYRFMGPTVPVEHIYTQILSITIKDLNDIQQVKEKTKELIYQYFDILPITI